jgi:hypothetical protein
MLRELASALEKTPAVTACAYCEYFGDRAYCSHWEANVPKQDQPHGCNAFLEEVPF